MKFTDPDRSAGLTLEEHQGETIVKAIKDVSLAIDDGEFVAVTGPAARARPRSCM